MKDSAICVAFCKNSMKIKEDGNWKNKMKGKKIDASLEQGVSLRDLQKFPAANSPQPIHCCHGTIRHSQVATGQLAA